MPYDAFISYSALDSVFAEEVHERLSEEGFIVWFDRIRLEPGLDWHRDIEQGCENSRVLLPVLTPRWKLADWTKFETYGAEAIIPLVYEGSWSDVATPPLERYQAEALNFKSRHTHSWRRVFSAIRRVIAQPPPDKVKRVTHLRYRANDYFAGRESELTYLHEEFHSKPRTSLTQGRVCALSGMGGAGKTTLARHYAEKYWRCYAQMFWVNCKVGFGPEFARIHDFLFRDRANVGMTDSEKAAAAVHELNGTQHRLLILDNAEDELSSMDWIPKTGACHTLVTSRFSQWSTAIKSIHIPVLKKESAIEFLQKRAHRCVGNSDLVACEVLAQKLGYLPLALEQAAAFVEQQGDGFGFSDYLGLYEKATSELLSTGVLGSTEYPDSVITTWKPTIERLLPGARIILRLCSYFASTEIPIALLISGSDSLAQYEDVLGHINQSSARPSNDEFWVRSQAANLKAYSLARFDGQSLIFHNLLQAVERSAPSPVEPEMIIDRAAALFLNYAPGEPYIYPHNITWRSLASHAEVLWDEMADLPPSQWRLDLPRTLALYHMDSGAVSRGASIQRSVLKESVRRFGPLHSDTLTDKNDLALILRDDSVDEALTLFNEVLDGRRQVNGQFSLEYAETLSNIGYVMQASGSAETEAMLKEAIAIFLKTSGPQHWRTLSVKSTLAAFLFHRGDFDLAESVFREVHAVRQRVFGTYHRDSLGSLRDLAYVLVARGSFLDALDHAQRAGSGLEISLGLGHPDTLQALQVLADILEKMNRRSEAVPIRQRRIAALARKPDATAVELRGAALNSYKIGDNDHAIALLHRVLSLGFDTPGTLCHLARISIVCDAFEDARAHADEAWTHREEAQQYTVVRILWLQLAIHFVEEGARGKTIALLRDLWSALRQDGAFMIWSMDPVLDHLKPKLNESDHALLEALVAALSDRNSIQALDAFPAWQEAIALV